MEYKAQYQEYLLQATAALDAASARFLPEESEVCRAARYSLLGGGKRIRAILTLSVCDMLGGEMQTAAQFAAAVEMLHCYSLIHDDLPCMDNDDLRRGRPTNHKVYGECVATLAGDALQAAAFQTVLSAEGPWQEKGSFAPAVAAKILAEAAGEQGMCGGQYFDTIGDGKVLHTAEELTVINNKKTGALLRAACMMGVAASSGHRVVEERCFEAARVYATNVGLAFQIRDDMLDVIGSAEEFGKPIGSDASNRKSTYVTLLGLEECERRVLAYTERAKEALRACKWQGSTEFLCTLADAMTERKK